VVAHKKNIDMVLERISKM